MRTFTVAVLAIVSASLVVVLTIGVADVAEVVASSSTSSTVPTRVTETHVTETSATSLARFPATRTRTSPRTWRTPRRPATNAFR